jgi:hypothetical protein
MERLAWQLEQKFLVRHEKPINARNNEDLLEFLFSTGLDQIADRAGQA